MFLVYIFKRKNIIIIEQYSFLHKHNNIVIIVSHFVI